MKLRPWVVEALVFGRDCPDLDRKLNELISSQIKNSLKIESSWKKRVIFEMAEKKTIKLYSLPNDDDLSSPPTLKSIQLILELIFFSAVSFRRKSIARFLFRELLARTMHISLKKGKEWTSLSYSCTKSNREVFMKTKIQWTNKRWRCQFSILHSIILWIVFGRLERNICNTDRITMIFPLFFLLILSFALNTNRCKNACTCWLKFLRAKRHRCSKRSA